MRPLLAMVIMSLLMLSMVAVLTDGVCSPPPAFQRYKKCSTATSSTAPPTATVLTADFITNLAAVRKSAQLKEWFLDIEIVKSALVTETIESHDSMLFQLSKSDAVHAAIKTISLKRMKDVQTE